MNVIKIRGEDRSPGDCLRVAVTAAYGLRYGFGYTDTPNPPIGVDTQAFWRTWFSWTPAPGLEWWRSGEFAPACEPRWIASVAQPGADDGGHAVVMEFGHLLLDPAQFQGDGRVYHRDVRLRDVHGALALVPEGTEFRPNALDPIDATRLAHWTPPLTIQRRVPIANAVREINHYLEQRATT